MDPLENKIGQTLKMTGGLFLFSTGVMFFYLLGNLVEFITLVLYTFSGLAAGMFFIGFGEFIQLLQGIYKQNKPVEGVGNKILTSTNDNEGFQ